MGLSPSGLAFLKPIGRGYYCFYVTVPDLRVGLLPISPCHVVLPALSEAETVLTAGPTS